MAASYVYASAWWSRTFFCNMICMTVSRGAAAANDEFLSTSSDLVSTGACHCIPLFALARCPSASAEDVCCEYVGAG